MSKQDTSNDRQLQQWLASPRARLLMQREHAVLRDVLSGLVGYRLLQVGEWGLNADLLAHAGTLCHWRLARRPDRPGDIGFDGVSLPIASASVDALLLAHTLDLTDQPHRLLRECERVLTDRGQLVLLGFNPLSWWALAQLVPTRSRHFVASAHFYTPGRVCDWLRLLGLEPEWVLHHGVGFPLFGRTVRVPQTANGRRSAWRLVAWTAQAYVVVARKRVIPRIALMPRGKRRKAPAREVGLASTGAGRVHSRR